MTHIPSLQRCNLCEQPAEHLARTGYLPWTEEKIYFWTCQTHLQSIQKGKVITTYNPDTGTQTCIIRVQLPKEK